jgi:hypothetical protein
LQALQVMLDIPMHKSIVSFADLAHFNVSTFGADALLQHLNDGGDAIGTMFPKHSVFIREFRRRILQDQSDDSEDQDEDGSINSGEQVEK